MIDVNRWRSMAFYQQMGNIASELSRAVRFRNQDDIRHMKSSLWRTLEMLDLTKDDKRNRSRLRELCRFKEVLSDWFSLTGEYEVSPESLKSYALSFAIPKE